MKKLTILIVAFAMLTSCNDKKDETKTTGDKKETATGEKISYPYTPEYSSDFSLGDPNHAKLVLDFIKLYEDDRMDEMKPMITDSVRIDFADGGKFAGPADSLIKLGKQFRSSYSAVKTKIDAWMPIHANDKNEDWVLIWSKDYTTKDGVVDSLAGHSYWQIKNNKIAYWSEFQAKLAPPPGQ